jgi:2TM domain
METEMTKDHTINGQKLGFRIHAIVFTATILGLLALDLALGGKFWTHWVILGWAPGLVAHWVGAGRNVTA